MSRKGQAPEREVLPDPRYDSKLVAKFINCMMWDGKKSASESILYQALATVQEKSQKDPLETFSQAIENIKPSVEVRSRRVGGATYQVPVEVRPRRRQALAIRWLIQYARERSEKTMEERLAAEILEAAGGQGNAIKKKQDTHRMADANKAFAHYRW